MKFSRFLLVLLFLFVLSLFFVREGMTQPLFGPEGGKEPRPGTRAPIIKHAFAVDKGYYGYIWKIYIEAEDPDGDMLRIASVVEQTGYGYYPTDWIYLKSPYQKQFKGYIQWNTFSSKTSYLTEWTQISLKDSVFDKAGNQSSEVIFPFTFEIGVKSPYQYTLPAPFDQGDLPRLGYVQIDLYDPTRMGGRDGGTGGGNP
jgi:hypothetical protein